MESKTNYTRREFREALQAGHTVFVDLGLNRPLPLRMFGSKILIQWSETHSELWSLKTIMQSDMPDMPISIDNSVYLPAKMERRSIDRRRA